jgi:hypothetical protein
LGNLSLLTVVLQLSVYLVQHVRPVLQLAVGLQYLVVQKRGVPLYKARSVHQLAVLLQLVKLAVFGLQLVVVLL